MDTSLISIADPEKLNTPHGFDGAHYSLMNEIISKWVDDFTDDGDTTGPPSDGRIDSSNPSSDDERPIPVMPPNAAQVPLPWMTSKSACAEDNPVWYRGFGEQLGCALPYDCATGAVSKRYASLPLEEPIDGSSQDELVDLDAAEGRRRGRELMALLQQTPEPKQPEVAEMSPSEPERLVHSPEAHKPPPIGNGCRGNYQYRAMPGANTGIQIDYPVMPIHPAGMKVPWGRNIDYSAHHAALCTAAHNAFGLNAVVVEPNGTGSFTVRLLEHASTAYLNEQDVLQMLVEVLWPVVNSEVRSLELTTNWDCPWLVMHCLHEDPEDAGKFCWDYAWHGSCPRGPRCRWPHCQLQSYTVEVSVGY